jgi:anti-sigma regulatory factor (Ser/Thr protein kinase)
MLNRDSAYYLDLPEGGTTMPAEASRASDRADDPALLPEWIVLGSLTVPGCAEHVRRARQFVARTLGDDQRADEALLLTSEVVTNSVVHSRSRLPGGLVTIMVARNQSGILITVTDAGSDARLPVVSNVAGAENGNGLLLVETLADKWGYLHNEDSTTVWFRLRAAGRTEHGASRLLTPLPGPVPESAAIRADRRAPPRGLRLAVQAEDGIADVTDGLVQVPDCLEHPVPQCAAGQVDRPLQAQADLE